MVFICFTKMNHWLLPQKIQMSKRRMEHWRNMRTELKTKMEFAPHSFANVLKATYLWMNGRIIDIFIWLWLCKGDKLASCQTISFQTQAHVITWGRDPNRPKAQASPVRCRILQYLRHLGVKDQVCSHHFWPYGVAEEVPNEDTVFKMTSVKNCEWLVRPHNAVSELSSTITGNLPIITNHPLLKKKSSFKAALPALQACCMCHAQSHTAGLNKLFLNFLGLSF